MERPTGVTLIAVLEIAGGVLAILGGGAVFLLSSVVAVHRAAFGGPFGGILGVLGAAAGTVLLLVGVLDIVLGIGMLKLKNWARLLTLIFAAISVLLHVLRLLRAMAHLMLFHAVWVAIFLAIGVLIIWYLLQPDVKKAFGES